MADKSYNVRLDLTVAEAITNIDEVLKRVQTLRSTMADLDESEIAFNVVVRNTGFQNMIVNLNKFMLKLEKDSQVAGQKIGQGLTKGVDDAGKDLSKSSGFNEATKKIAAKVKSEMEGSLSGLTKSLDATSGKIQKSLEGAFSKVGKTIEKTIAESVTKGMTAGLRGITSGATKTFNAQALTFQTNFNQLDRSMDNIHRMAAALERIVDTIKSASQALSAFDRQDRNAAWANARDMAKGIAKTSAHDTWSENNMSLKDRRHAEVEERRVAIEEEAMALAKLTHQYAQEREQIKLTNAEKREDIKLQKELKNMDRKTKSVLKTQERQQELLEVQISREKRKDQEEELKLLNRKKQLQDQYNALERYEAENANRIRVEDSEIEKQIYAYRKASLRVLQQQTSTLRGNHVDESAIAQAAKDKKDAEIRATQEILKQIQGYDRIKQSSEQTVKSLNKAATAMQRWSSAVSSIGGILSTFRQLSTTMASSIQKAGSTFLGYARQAASSIASAATEQYRQLELAQIGFTNFYGDAQAKDLIKQIKEQAMVSPGVDAGDLASYVRQLAPVSEGNSQQALDAAMGMLKTIQYGGGEASEEMEYVIKNIRDVISKGTATAIDLRQFNRAMPIMEDVLESIGKSEFIKNGQLKIDKNNAKDLLQAFADINNDPNSPVVDIFEKMSNTLSGITDVIKQTFITKFNDTLIDLGFYDKVKEILRDLSESGAIEKFYTFLANAADKILDFVKSLDWEGISKSGLEGAKNIWNAIRDVARDIMKTIGAADLPSLLLKVMNIVENFIRGFGDGINKVLQFVGKLDKVSPDMLNKLAGLMGVLSSPFGKLAQAGMGILQNTLGFGSRVTYNAAAKYQERMENKLSSIEEWVKKLAMTGKYGPNGTASVTDNPIVRGAAVQNSIDPTSVTMGGSLKRNSRWMWNKAADQFASQNKDGSWRTAGGLNNFYGLSGYTPSSKDAAAYNSRGQSTKFKDYLSGKSQQWNVLGDGSTVKGAMRDAQSTIKSAAKKFAAFAGDMTKSLAYKAIGDGISQVAGEIAQYATGDARIGRMTKDLGEVASTFIALTATGHPLLGLFGALGVSVKNLAEVIVETTNNMKSELEKAQNAMYALPASKIHDMLIEQFREKGLFEMYNDNDSDAEKKMTDEIYKQLKAGKSVDEVVELAKQAYLDRRAGNNAYTELINWMDNNADIMGSGTAIDANRDKAQLKNLYDNLVNAGVIDQAAISPNAFIESKSLSGNELLNYLNKAGFDINSVEGLNALVDKTNEIKNKAEEAKNMEVKITPMWAGPGPQKAYNTFEELFANTSGFTKLSEGGPWVSTVQLQTVVDLAWKVDKDLYQKIKEQLEAIGDTTITFKSDTSALQNQLNKTPAGLGIDPLTNKPIGTLTIPGRTAGGLIAPIYRAGGGDTPSRGVDTVPAMLQPGEFVMRKSAVNRFGTGVFNALNIGDLGKAAQLLGAKFTGNWNNSRTYGGTYYTTKNISNRVSVFNRTNSGRVSSYNSLANRLATGF